MKKVIKQLQTISPFEPNELLCPHIDISSNREVYVEGCTGIIEYNSSVVRINCKRLILKITGTDLTIRSEAIDQISVLGNIISLDFTGA